MIKNPILDSIEQLEVVVVYKHSRFIYAKERGSKKERLGLLDESDPITKDLVTAHEKNLRCIEAAASALEQMGIRYHMLCRSELSKLKLRNKFVISIGGDGTLLDTSHYCEDSPILGVNSDPQSSIGALCVATIENFPRFINDIYQGKLAPSCLTRLSATMGDRVLEPLALNDVLFCHKNPASMSRFSLSFRGEAESHRASGIWIATAAGSTGGILSSGGEALPLDADLAIFRLREPYWADKMKPKLLTGTIKRNEKLIIRSNMTEAEAFIDGPHEMFAVGLGDTVEISLANQPLWLFDGPCLNDNRNRIIERRHLIRDSLV